MKCAVENKPPPGRGVWSSAGIAPDHAFVLYGRSLVPRGVVGSMARALTILALVSLASGFGRAEDAPVDRLVVGGDAAYPPFEWLDGERRPQGFNVELIRLLAEPVGVEVEFRLGDWPDTLAALDAGEIDVVPMFVSDERRRRYR